MLIVGHGMPILARETCAEHTEGTREMRCIACNAGNAELSRFCINCGTALAIACDACGQSNPVVANFCSECGSSVAVACIRCDSRIPAMARFCMECGNRVRRTAVAPGATKRPRVTRLLAPMVNRSEAETSQGGAQAPDSESATSSGMAKVTAASPRAGSLRRRRAVLAPRPSRPRLIVAERPVLTTPMAEAAPSPRDERLEPDSDSVGLEGHTPRHLVEKILSSRAALEGERKQVTVLFADVKGSTEVIQSLDPEDAQQLLDGVVKAMMEAVHRYEGTVNHILGDGIMALFGAPIAHEDHAVRACYAALAMQEAVARYGEETRDRYGFAVSVRVGLNSGEVIVRAIANDLRMDYSAMGQTVHLAARMEQNARVGTILLTPETARLADGYIQVHSVGPITVKGVDEPIEVFELLGTGTIRTRLQASAARGLTRFVGREAELRAIEEAFSHAAAGDGRAVALCGEAGTGKSRLIWEVMHSYRTHEWLVVESSAVAYGMATPYLPVIDLLKNYFRISSTDDREAIREKVVGKLLTLDEALDTSAIPILALLDVPTDDPVWKSLEPPQRRKRTQQAVVQLLLREARNHPLLVVIENLHWVDGETRALLEALLERLSGARVVLLVSYRPEYQDDWRGRPYHTMVELSVLPANSAQELLRSLLGDDPSVQPLTQRLIEQTLGNPFFLEECVRSLDEAGTLVGERGAYTLVETVSRIRVPSTVQAVLATRIDRLSPEEKRLLQSAAVIGKDIPYALLAAIAELPEDQLHRQLGRLQVAEFIYETRSFPELEYTFRHALTQDVAYEGLLQQRRRALHTQIVAAIEGLYPERLTEHLDRLAQHAFVGEVWSKAVSYSRQAAAKSVTKAAYRAAVSGLERALGALDHLPDAPKRTDEAIDLHLELRSCLLPLGDMQSIYEHLREAERGAEALGDSFRLARIYSYLCQYFSVIRDPDQAVSFGERAHALAEQVGDLAVRVPASFLLGEALYSLGQFHRGADVLRQILSSLQGDRQYERYGMTGLPASMSQYILAQCLAELGDFAEASSAANEAIRIAEVASQPFSLASALSINGFVSLLKGDLLQAIQTLERSVELCRTWNFSIHLTNASARLGYAHVLSGAVDAGLSMLEQTAKQAESLGRLYEQASIIGWLGLANLRAGHRDEALDLALRAYEVADQSRQQGKRAHTLRILADVHAAFGPSHFEQAEDYYRRALLQARESGMRPLQAHCHLGLGVVHSRTERPEQAETELSRAIDLFRSMDMTFWLPQANEELVAVGAADGLKV